MTRHSMREIWLIRHGESRDNVVRRIQGWGGSGLSDRGRVEAGAAAERVAGLGPSVVLSSDLERAVETASIISRRAGVPLRTDERFREIKVGPWEGRLLAEVEREDPDAIARWRVDARIPPHPGMESLEELLGRLLAGISAAIAETPGDGPIAVVSHGGAISAVVTHILGLELLSLGQMPVFNASLSLTLWSGKRAILGSYNETGHLPPRDGPGFNAL